MSIIVENIRAGYSGFELRDISLNIPTGGLTALIGPNGSGKSTLLNAIARILPLRGGTVRIGDLDIAKAGTRDMARKLAMLPQSPMVPPSVRVAQLVGYGRAPHQNILGMKTQADRDAIEYALGITSTESLRDRLLSELSGGQRQRVFIAMCLAQDTPYLLFDEPTSFLDIKYQYETLKLIVKLKNDGRTCVVVLHDIAQAARFADQLVILKEGAVDAIGAPETVVTSEMLSRVYGIDAQVFPDPQTKTPAISPVHK